ncbi:MAG: hypothetical protein E6Q88_12610 [Lysobacteraceae bacterium]|nr:MAG: hypothetical protein E6Q88_12610 [Xanthomonadaceae bacterium]
MRKPHPTWGLFALLITMSALAGKNGPWAEIKLDGDTNETLGEYRTVLVAIDGSREIVAKALYELQPGRTRLQLASRKRGKSGEMTSLPYEIELKPCVRYLFVADHAQQTETRRWRPVVKSEEPIKACVKRFGTAGTGEES